MTQNTRPPTPSQTPARKPADPTTIEGLNQALRENLDEFTRWGESEPNNAHIMRTCELMEQQMQILDRICRASAREAYEQECNKDRRLGLALRAQSQFRSTLLTAMKVNRDTGQGNAAQNSGTNYTKPDQP